MNDYYLLVKIFDHDKLIHKGSLVNLPSEQIKLFKTKEEAEKFIYDFAIEEVKEGYKIEFEIISGKELDKEIPMKPNRQDRYCGRCDINRLIKGSDKYCSVCGQKIDWGDND